MAEGCQHRETTIPESINEDFASGGSSDKAAEPGAALVEERCPICLDDYQNKAFITTCFHAFCFTCVVKAAEVTGRACPLCKVKFNKVIHNIRANNDYDLYRLSRFQPSSRPRQSESGTSGSAIAISSDFLGRAQGHNDFDQNRQQYFNSMSFHNGSRNTTVSIRGSSSNCAGEVRGYCGRGRRAANGRDGGQGIVNLAGRGNSGCGYGRNVRASWHRGSSTGVIRKSVYSAGVWAQPCSSDGIGRRVGNITATFFRKNPTSSQRLMEWLSREIEVLLGREFVTFMSEHVLSIIAKVNLESEEFASHLEPFLEEKTAHFMHEFISFAKSPYDMIAYDRKVIYDWPPGALQRTMSSPGRSCPGQRSGEVDPAEASSSSTAGPVHLSGLDADMRQNVFYELTSAEPTSPLRYTSSPIIIHGSSSEEDIDRTDSDFPEHLEQGVILTGTEETLQQSTVRVNQATRNNIRSVVPQESTSVSRSNVLPTALSGGGLSTVLEIEDASIDPVTATNESNEPPDQTENFMDAFAAERHHHHKHHHCQKHHHHRHKRHECHHCHHERHHHKHQHHKHHHHMHQHHKHHHHERHHHDECQHCHRRTNRIKSRERGREHSKSPEHKRRLVDGSSEKEIRRGEGWKSEVCCSNTMSASSNFTKGSGRSSSGTSTSESEESYHRQCHDQHKHRCEEDDKLVCKRKRKQLVDLSKTRGCVNLESGRQGPSPGMTHTAGGVSTDNNHLTQVHHVMQENHVTHMDHVTQENLVCETQAIEKEISNGKEKILKSLLRKERMELLHKNTHDTTLGSGDGNAPSEGVASGSGIFTDEVLRAQLAELDEEIICEKRKLLCVLKKIEMEKRSNKNTENKC